MGDEWQGDIQGQELEVDVVQLIRQQHDHVRDLFANIASGDRAAIGELLDEVAVHLEVEEAVLYAALLDTELAQAIRVAAEEHLSVKRLIADLVEADPRDARFWARLTVLRRQIEDHMEEEETEVLPEVERIFDVDQRIGLAQEMMGVMHTLAEDGEDRALEALLSDAAQPAV
jgi:hypothetical protein